jgi:hypothetical protein
VESRTPLGRTFHRHALTISFMTQFTIGPRDFIMGPFIMCPHYGAQSFGVLRVDEDRYLRRCKSCLGANFYDLPPLKKRII